MRSGIMLCYPYDVKRFVSWGNKALIQPKLDGERCRAIIKEGNVTLRSSQGNEIISVPHIKEELTNLWLKNIELDGELYIHGMPFEEIHSIVSRKVNQHPDYKDMEYHVFDIASEHTQLHRMELLDKLPIDLVNNHIRKVQTSFVMSEEDICYYYDRYIEAGYEGFILRNCDNAYQRARSTALLKFKPRKEDIYEIVGYTEEHDISGRPKDTLGALVVVSDDNSLFSVGTGFTTQMRIDLWKGRDTLKGKRCKVKFQQLTIGRGVPRFPVFAHIKE